MSNVAATLLLVSSSEVPSDLNKLLRLFTEDDQILRDWVNSYEHISQSESGLIRVRLLKQEGKHPLFPVSTEWLLMCEGKSERRAALCANPFLLSFNRYQFLISDCKSNLAALNASF